MKLGQDLCSSTWEERRGFCVGTGEEPVSQPVPILQKAEIGLSGKGIPGRKGCGAGSGCVPAEGSGCSSCRCRKTALPAVGTSPGPHSQPGWGLLGVPQAMAVWSRARIPKPSTAAAGLQQGALSATVIPKAAVELMTSVS